ncbi:hypothetical protein [Photobacterium galatheae]|uniref:Uncharacterized protein n=1 Tax=Photobacterium galatheae TaxID=1654360 RepID=A0A066RPT7_9GAMM|nr:hypothetical protein [Photobacterium galatheae]KDM92374.1 hypothetical protein EA58_06550 [Photobacterium galatheae]MCM0150883.1 hypothetical protein [Photobacterium galatheae]
MKKLPLILCALFSLNTFAATYSQDRGIISTVYVNPEGAIALKLQDGFPKAKGDNQCPNANGWAGLKMADNVIKSAILAAKTANLRVMVTIEGCEGDWFKVKDIYLN